MNWNAAPVLKNEAADSGDGDFCANKSGKKVDIFRGTCDECSGMRNISK